MPDQEKFDERVRVKEPEGEVVCKVYARKENLEYAQKRADAFTAEMMRVLKSKQEVSFHYYMTHDFEEDLKSGDVVEITVRKRYDSPLPAFARFFVFAFLPKSYRDIILGDLTESYVALRAKRGRFRACARVYKQVFLSAWPLFKESGSRRRAIVFSSLSFRAVEFFIEFALLAFLIYELVNEGRMIVAKLLMK